MAISLHDLAFGEAQGCLSPPISASLEKIRCWDSGCPSAFSPRRCFAIAKRGDWTNNVGGDLGLHPPLGVCAEKTVVGGALQDWAARDSSVRDRKFTNMDSSPVLLQVRTWSQGLSCPFRPWQEGRLRVGK